MAIRPMMTRTHLLTHLVGCLVATVVILRSDSLVATVVILRSDSLVATVVILRSDSLVATVVILRSDNHPPAGVINCSTMSRGEALTCPPGAEPRSVE